VETAIEFRDLERSELSLIREIDRTERIDVLYEQQGTTLVARHGEWSASAWAADDRGEHSVEAKVREAQGYLDGGGIAQLAFLHVSATWRATGIGARLCAQLDQVARSAGDSEMVVSATSSENTVRFYLGRGFEPTAEPLAELFALEPEDVHMRKPL
jgi:GNAT superfamily N-acetyltransferase